MITRQNLVTGPARIVRGTGTVYSKSNFSVDIVKAQTPLVVDGLGQIDSLDEDALVSCQFNPEGRWNAATRGFLFPYLNPAVGLDIFGNADVPTVIHDSNAHIHTIIASAITQMPSLILSAAQTMIGQATITGVRGTGLDWNDASSLYTHATSGGTFVDAAFVPSDIKVQNYTGAWGAVAGFGTISTEAGWQIDFQTDIGFLKCDEVGTFKAILRGVIASARCTPTETTQAQILAALDYQESASRRGKGGNALAADLTITGADGSAIVVLKSAKLLTAGMRFGAGIVRNGELAWVATRNFTSGVGQAIATLA